MATSLVVNFTRIDNVQENPPKASLSQLKALDGRVDDPLLIDKSPHKNKLISNARPTIPKLQCH